ncbi:MAG: hypothetical protein RIQ91_435, partial [Bacteroidota bacterium]
DFGAADVRFDVVLNAGNIELRLCNRIQC